MKIINVNTNIYPNIGAYISASDECAIALKQLGITYVNIKTHEVLIQETFICLGKTKNCLKKKF